MQPWISFPAVSYLLPLRCRGLIRPVRSKLSQVPYARYLHDTKDRDSTLQGSSEDNHAPAQHSPESPDVHSKNERHSESSDVKQDVHPHAAKWSPREPTEAQRIARLAILEKGRRASMTEAHLAAVRAGFEKHRDEQRALGYPQLREAGKASLESQRALGFPNMQKARKRSSEVVHAQLVRDIEVANQRKLKEDPTFVPTPLPVYSGPRTYPPRAKGKIPCSEPGCKSLLLSERSLEAHVRTKHSSYSAKTPHKCKDSSCCRYFETRKEADAHLKRAHANVTCSICDRAFAYKYGLYTHMRNIHGMNECRKAPSQNRPAKVR